MAAPQLFKDSSIHTLFGCGLFDAAADVTPSASRTTGQRINVDYHTVDPTLAAYCGCSDDEHISTGSPLPAPVAILLQNIVFFVLLSFFTLHSLSDSTTVMSSPSGHLSTSEWSFAGFKEPVFCFSASQYRCHAEASSEMRDRLQLPLRPLMRSARIAATAQRHAADDFRNRIDRPLALLRMFAVKRCTDRRY